MKKVVAGLRTLWTQIRIRRTWELLLWILGGILALFVWLVWPAMRHPLLRVQGSNVAVAIDCVPEAISLVTRAGYLQLRNAKLVTVDSNGNEMPATQQFQTRPIELGGEHSYELRLTSEQQSNAIKSIAGVPAGSVLRFSAEFARVPAIDLYSAEILASRHPSNPKCKSTHFDAEGLKERVLSSRSEVLHLLLLQEEVSDLLMRINGSVGTVCIGALLVSLVWLIYQLACALGTLFIVPNDVLKARLSERLRRSSLLKAKTEVDLIKGEFALCHRRLAFARVIGPAVGFLLTVSSLVAGLHPSQQSSDDSFQFVSSLQLALVATFVGLLIRILAEFAIRTRTAASERALLLFTKPCVET